MKTYLVGGAVRDRLLNLPIHEKDWVVVGSTVEEMLARQYKPVGKDFPVFLHPETKEEYALARTERKSGKGYKGFLCHASPEVTLEEDLLRRDLTINAMAMDNSGTLIDPYGGTEDLKNKLLRHVSPAFEEDPVRILRIARFIARFHHLGFTIAPETMQLMEKMVQEGCMNDLVPERIWAELNKSLSEKNPEFFFKTLRECGALSQILPELEALFGVPNPPKWHPEIDSGWHTYSVLEQAVLLTEDVARIEPATVGADYIRPSAKHIRFAALVHDLGKGDSPLTQWPSHRGHEESGVKRIQQLSKRLKIPKVYEKYGILTARFHSQIHKCFEQKPENLLNLFQKMDAFRQPERFLDILMVCKADARGRPGHEKENYPQEAYLTKLLKSLLSISVKPFVEKGLAGNAIADALSQARLTVISEYQQQCQQ